MVSGECELRPVEVPARMDEGWLWMRVSAIRTMAIVAMFGCSGAGNLEGQRWPSDPETARMAARDRAEVQCSPQLPVLTGQGSLGPIEPGMTLGDVEEVCGTLQFGWRMAEGTPSPVAITRLGEATFLLVFVDTLATARIYAIETSHPAARTADGVGPGSTARELGERWPDARPVFGEGVYALSPTHDGISLELSFPEPFDWRVVDEIRRTGNWDVAPEETKVSGVSLPWMTRGGGLDS